MARSLWRASIPGRPIVTNYGERSERPSSPAAIGASVFPGCRREDRSDVAQAICKAHPTRRQAIRVKASDHTQLSNQLILKGIDKKRAL